MAASARIEPRSTTPNAARQALPCLLGLVVLCCLVLAACDGASGPAKPNQVEDLLSDGHHAEQGFEFFVVTEYDLTTYDRYSKDTRTERASNNMYRVTYQGQPVVEGQGWPLLGWVDDLPIRLGPESSWLYDGQPASMAYLPRNFGTLTLLPHDAPCEDIAQAMATRKFTTTQFVLFLALIEQQGPDLGPASADLLLSVVDRSARVLKPGSPMPVTNAWSRDQLAARAAINLWWSSGLTDRRGIDRLLASGRDFTTAARPINTVIDGVGPNRGQRWDNNFSFNSPRTDLTSPQLDRVPLDQMARRILELMRDIEASGRAPEEIKSLHTYITTRPALVMVRRLREAPDGPAILAQQIGTFDFGNNPDAEQTLRENYIKKWERHVAGR